MRTVSRSLWAAGLMVLAATKSALADFSTSEIPQYFQDQTPDWIFQILAAILIALSQALYAMFSGGAV